VGIGVTPSANQGKLQANGAGQSWFKFYDSTAGWNFGTFYKANGTTALAYLGGGGGSAIAGGSVDDFVVRAEGNLLLAIGSTEKARIDSSGNLLVGTTSNTNSSRIKIDWTTGNYGFYSKTSADTLSYHLVFGNANYASAGNISTTNNTTAYGTTSDYRAKDNIAPMINALNVVAQLKPCTYKWKDTDILGQGFIAHEIQEIIPDAVAGEKDAVDANGDPIYQSIDTSFLVATLTAAIQEQQALITTLTDRITALEAK
jgi:hypothetical protein